MLGLTEEEFEKYKELAQDFAITEVTPKILLDAEFIAPLVTNGKGKRIPDSQFVNHLITDIETVVTIVTVHMSYEYAFLQYESEMTEQEIISHLHSKFEDYLVTQFIKYGVGFTTDVLEDTISDIILELPYLYVAVIEDENFDEDSFLEEKLDAYNDYLEQNNMRERSDKTIDDIIAEEDEDEGDDME